VADVLVERRGDAAWLTLNHPERLNAYDLTMAHELRQCVDDARDAGVIVITGAGRAFCAGGYLADMANISPDTVRMLYRSSLDLFEAIRLSPRPVIAAVNGAAAGGGNELVVACDLAIAADSATLGQTGVRIGSSPVLGGANMLAMAVGEKRAKEVAFLCRRYRADEAMAMGWINAVVPAEQLVEEVDRWCDELLAMSPRYLEITKSVSNVWWNAARDSYLQGTGMLIQAIGSHDMREGANAFMEKRKPEWEPRQPVSTSVAGPLTDPTSLDGVNVQAGQ
jgi:2-ketocyclohexanecarboxyl-CoA hydrolase